MMNLESKVQMIFPEVVDPLELEEDLWEKETTMVPTEEVLIVAGVAPQEEET